MDRHGDGIRHWGFPTRVGVNRNETGGNSAGSGLPHAGGGEPVWAPELSDKLMASPRGWG